MIVTTVSAAPPVVVAVDDIEHVAATMPAHEQDVTRSGPLPPWRAREFVAARTLLRAVLAGVEPAARDARIRTRPGGGPALEGWPSLAVSLTHDGSHVGAAVGRCSRVGVDVQVPPDAVHPGLLRRCLRQHAADLDVLDRRAAALAFTRVWTVQEACVKAAGTGLAGLPWLIDVPPGKRSGRWGDLAWVTLPDLWAVPVAAAWSEEAS